MSDRPALEATGLGLRNRKHWTLRDGAFRVPRGRVAALVGPNGGGKSSLIAAAAGLRDPDEGELRVLGHRPGSPEALPRVGVLLQDRPLPAAFTVAELLRLGRELNPCWDDAGARSLLADAGLPLHARAGALSGGERSCVALALALGKQPELLLLDEPFADLDPLRKHTMTAAVLTAAAELGTTVVLSSHHVTELDLVCDYVLLIARGRILVADDIEFVQAAHTLVTCVVDGAGTPAALAGSTVIESRTAGRRLTAMVRLPTGLPGAVHSTPPTLDEILLAYLRNPDAPPLLAPSDTPGGAE